ncbi:MAG: hypothetical protein H6511_02510 [Holophagales bacterium]|nr:hypothetical protein [Holophagales bacterium]
MRRVSIVLALTALLVGFAGSAEAGQHRLGFGFHWWKTVDDLAGDRFNDIESDGVSQVFSYQYLPGGLIKLEADVEYFKDGFGGSTSSAWSPQFFVLFGSFVYAGVGVGITNSSSFESDWSDPFYAARAGFDLLLLPKLHLDLNANYSFDAWSELENVDTETLTLGAIARFSF